MMRRDDFPHTLDDDEERGCQQGQCDDDAGDGLGFAVTEGMVVVRRQSGDLQPRPDHA
jgi:hypothetical protein